MYFIAGLVVCFLGAWFLAYRDHGASFIEMFVDIPGLLFGMALSAFLLGTLYGILKYVFEE